MKSVVEGNSCFFMIDESFKTVINLEMQLGKTWESATKTLKQQRLSVRLLPKTYEKRNSKIFQGEF